MKFVVTPGVANPLLRRTRCRSLFLAVQPDQAHMLYHRAQAQVLLKKLHKEGYLDLQEADTLYQTIHDAVEETFERMLEKFSAYSGALNLRASPAWSLRRCEDHDGALHLVFHERGRPDSESAEPLRSVWEVFVSMSERASHHFQPTRDDAIYLILTAWEMGIPLHIDEEWSVAQRPETRKSLMHEPIPPHAVVAGGDTSSSLRLVSPHEAPVRTIPHNQGDPDDHDDHDNAA